MLILVCGLPGTGKSTVARYISEKISAQTLRTDVIRKEMTDKPEYSGEEKEKVYGELFRRAESLLREGKNVIIDATFFRKSLRENARELSERVGSDMKVILCVSPEEVIEKRINEGRGDESDADFEVYEKVKGEWEEIEGDYVEIDTSKEWRKEIDAFF